MNENDFSTEMGVNGRIYLLTFTHYQNTTICNVLRKWRDRTNWKYGYDSGTGYSFRNPKDVYNQKTGDRLAAKRAIDCAVFLHPEDAAKLYDTFRLYQFMHYEWTGETETARLP